MSKIVVLGKFSPLHMGHIQLIDFAYSISRKTNTELVILVDNNTEHSMDIETRTSVLRKTYPYIDIRPIQESTYQDPSEYKEFWDYWKKIFTKYIPEGIDTIVGSMNYVKTLADVLNCKSIIVDRGGIPISASQIQSDINLYWDYLAPESKKIFLKNIAIMGAESSGKSTLTKKIAEYFQTNYVPEYGRTFVETYGQDFSSEDMIHIADIHNEHAESLKKMSNKVLIYDTEAITTQIWTEFFFNERKREIDAIIKKQKIDLYILIPVQDTWVEDPVRYQKEKDERIEFYNKIKKELVIQNKNFIEIKEKDWMNIESEIIKVIKEIL